MRTAATTLAACLLVAPGLAGQTDVFDRVKHGYAVSEGGVKIHYATLGAGPLVVMIHGFPDFWYTWRHSMDALADKFQVVAIDQRGYNLSDKPKGVESYDMRLLVADVAAVVRHLGRDKATIVGHDWGGMVAWQFAMNVPAMTERLIVLNLPHPAGLLRELKSNPEQIANSEYARTFQRGSPGDPKIFFGRPMTPETLSGWVRDAAARKHYVEAFARSDFDAMLNYYKANYPKGSGADAPPVPPLPKVGVPVLMFHGLGDQALHRNGLAGTWDWLDKDLTLVTIPGAGHFVQQDAAELVTSTMKWWLAAQTAAPQPAKAVLVVFETELGDITMEVDVARAPITAQNFLKYVDGKFFDGGMINRAVRPDNTVRKDVEIQVIQFQINPERRREQFPPIAMENTSVTGLKHVDGALSMARLGPDTATASFSITIGAQPEMDFGGKRNADGHGFAVFGKVVRGMDVVKKIQASPTRAAGQPGAYSTEGLEPPIKVVKAYRKAG